jgi:hypothetical protein
MVVSPGDALKEAFGTDTESVWPIRSRHEYAIGVAVIEMAPGDTTVGSTPSRRTRSLPSVSVERNAESRKKLPKR